VGPPWIKQIFTVFLRDLCIGVPPQLEMEKAFNR
jgi:hypothetical protein